MEKMLQPETGWDADACGRAAEGDKGGGAGQWEDG
jgi:hypothetical protein